MLFNSIDFAIFLPVVFFLYWFVCNRNLKLQNLLLLLSSYTFYAWWDWRFLSLIVVSSFLDYCVGIALNKTKDDNKRKMFLWFSIFTNLGFLVFFKYFNFFIDSFVDAFSLFGYRIERTLSLQIILPVGISFYTFQTLSYTIDVYKKKLHSTSNLVVFFAYVSFFPQLMAGPIERAINLLPQFYRKREFNYNKAVDGMRQVLWGLLKKTVIADNCATYANEIFNNYTEYSGSTLFIGALFFTFQIYADFSGYSDIAIGVSRLFGFDLMKNFSFPYFSRDIAEFWRRWHISLTTWFRDYVYIPLGGSKGSIFIKIRNTFVIFIISGLWHGANWTFVMWGLVNAFYFIPLLLLNKNRKNIEIVAQGKLFPSLKELFQMISTFCLVVIGWIFFRANTVSQAFDYIGKIFSKSFFSFPKLFSPTILIIIILFMFIEWIQRDKNHALQLESTLIGNHRLTRWFLYLILTFTICFFKGSEQEFIYFQF